MTHHELHTHSFTPILQTSLNETPFFANRPSTTTTTTEGGTMGEKRFPRLLRLAVAFGVAILVYHAGYVRFVAYRLGVAHLQREILRPANLEAARGRTVLLSGATKGGIGFEAAKVLLQHGATVHITMRSKEKCAETTRMIIADSSSTDLGGRLQCWAMDFTDLADVERETNAIISQSGVTYDVVLNNAAIWPTAQTATKQGFDVAYGTNVLAPVLLTEKLIAGGKVRDGATIAFITGDIYIICMNWAALELQRRFGKRFTVVIGHPGIIVTNLVAEAKYVKYLFPGFLLEADEGAQNLLFFAAANKGELVRGGYYHNVMGLVRTEDFPHDPMLNSEKRAKFIRRLWGEELSGWLRVAKS